MTHSRITLKLKASRLHSGRGKEVCFQGKGGGACLKSFAAKMFAPKIFAELYVCSKKFCGYRILL